MFNIEGKRLCWQCAMKFLGIEGLPFEQQWKTVTDFDQTLRE